MSTVYFTYILYSGSKDKFYIGECNDLEERLSQHNNGHYSNSFTTFTSDWQLYYSIQCDSRSQARMIEAHIKKMKSRKYFENLKKYPEIAEQLKGKYYIGSQSR